MAWTVMAMIGRALLASLFILAGAAKLFGPKPFLVHMDACGVPKFLLPGVIALELVAGALTLIGWQTRWAALALSVFCIAAAVVFHRNWSDRAERTLFLKDVELAGGLLVLASQ